MSDYLRARSPEQKAERMNAIMDAAENLFRYLPYHETVSYTHLTLPTICSV